MADKTLIAWTDRTFNPWIGCTKVSAGCDHCYAETMSTNRMGLHVWGQDAARNVTTATYWRQPVAWHVEARRSAQRLRVFCGSMCDWAEKHPVAEATRPKLWELIRRTPWLDWQLLTKRTGRIERCLPADWGNGYPNVWLGTSIENMDVAFRADQLRSVPAALRFISFEPALGPLNTIDLTGIHWLIYGGESGPGYRPHDIQWARDIRARCEQFGTSFFFKQSAAPRTEMGIELDGAIVRAWPRGRARQGFEKDMEQRSGREPSFI